MSPPWSRGGDSATGLPVSVHPRGQELVCVCVCVHACARTCGAAWRRTSASPRSSPPSLTCSLMLSQNALSELCAGSWARGLLPGGSERAGQRQLLPRVVARSKVWAGGAGVGRGWRPKALHVDARAGGRHGWAPSTGEAGGWGPLVYMGSPRSEQWGCRGPRRGAGRLGPPLAHCPHPSAGGQVGAEGACGVTGVTPTGAAARVPLSQSRPPSCP